MFKKIKKIISKHKIIFLLLLMALIGACYFIISSFTNKVNTATRYTIGTVEKGSLITTTSGTGQVYVSDQIDMRAKVSGSVIDVYKKAGDKLKSGDVILKLDTKDITKQITNAQLSVETAKDKLNNLISPYKLSVLQAFKKF